MGYRRNPFVWLAWALVLVALVLPLGAMLLRSVTFYEVELVDGRVDRAVGEVIITDEEHRYDLQAEGELEKQAWSELNEDVKAVHTVYAFDHYKRVFGDSRTLKLLKNSTIIGLGGALLALLLGLPLAWILARVQPAGAWLHPTRLAPVQRVLTWLGPRLARLGITRARTSAFAACAALLVLGLCLATGWRRETQAAPLFLIAALVLGVRSLGDAFDWRAFVRSWVPSVRTLLVIACLVPAILPPFFIALGGARTTQGWLIAAFGVEGGTLQILNSICVFGCVLFPLYVLLVGPAFAAVPAGPWEAARILGGRRAAWRTVTLPAVLPAVVGAFLLAFVIALTDFAVPDVLGFMLPSGGTPTHVFATEILLQWKQNGNTARAVATGAPFLVVTVALLFTALAFIRRSPAFHTARGARRLPRARVAFLGTLLCALLLIGILGVALVLPLTGIASWAGDGGESSARGTENPGVVTSTGVELFDFKGTLDRTSGSREERDRWLWTAFVAACLAMLIAAPLARVATRGGRFARGAVLVVGALPLAVPGLVLGAGTLLLWQAIPGDWVRPLEEGITRSALVLAARFLPYALVAAWLGMRALRPGHEEAAAVLGASPRERAWRIVAPATWMGVAAGGVLVLLMALRELDTVVLVDARILPMRLYDKIHFNRMADEANLLFLCLAWFLVPALLAAVMANIWRRARPR